LPPEVKETYEQRANAAKERFNAAMSDYKKTPQFVEYQDYLVEFKAKHGPSRSGMANWWATTKLTIARRKTF
jgi:hypothetical protein